MVNAPLTIRDPRGVAQPRLAADLPSRENGSWTVEPDGTMRTTWKIRPNAVWHDGQPVTARDFEFAFRVALDDRIPIDNRRPEQFMDRIEALDDKTFVIHWKQVYPWANELGGSQLEPLPHHIMGSVYESSSAEAFMADPFWSSSDYIGVGPYRLVRWDAGTQLVFQAFDQYVLGRPKINEVTFRLIPDPNTVVANLLAGETQVAVNIALGQQAGATVRDQWKTSGEGTVLAVPTRFRFVDIQMKPGDLGQPALLDARVRRALTHGLDRESLAEIATAGMADVTEVFLAPTDQLYESANRAVARYPYDVNRALALLQEAGWTKQGDALVNASGQPFGLDIFSSEGPDNETEQAIIAADYRKLGMQVTETVYPRSRARDREFRSKFPGLNPTALTIEVPETLVFGLSDTCPRPPRYAGSNRGCWTNPEFDRLYQVASTSLDRAERGNAIVQALKIVTEDAGKIPLSYRADALAFRKGLVGPGARWPGQGDVWNIHEWRWE
jgi:peptide/nickel transport system substrate-binding protein